MSVCSSESVYHLCRPQRELKESICEGLGKTAVWHRQTCYHSTAPTTTLAKSPRLSAALTVTTPPSHFLGDSVPTFPGSRPSTQGQDILFAGIVSDIKQNGHRQGVRRRKTFLKDEGKKVLKRRRLLRILSKSKIFSVFLYSY